jgi:hypothetical protein
VKTSLRELCCGDGRSDTGSWRLPLKEDNQASDRAASGSLSDSGALTIFRCEVVRRASLLEFIAGGCEISLAVGIDFTGD